MNKQQYAGTLSAILVASALLGIIAGMWLFTLLPATI